ncbi:hypothetical protein [Parapedobacter soli]|uniref:hypothetical protein n=1 Tax=Parapedobacter soli TaxID=416955 RepID=UPI0021CA9723|nr:hypothetical protein [Parapedobacter soli]
MGKKLLTDDYNEIVKGAFKIDESDFHNYYLNIVNEHYESNNDIAEKLIEFVEKWADGFRGYVIDHDNAILSYDRFKAWNAGGLFFPLPNNLSQQLGIIRQVNKPFFDGQIEQIERIKTLIELRELQKKLESLAPKIVVNATNELCPYNGELDFEKINERKRILDLVTMKFDEGKRKPKNNDKVPNGAQWAVIFHYAHKSGGLPDATNDDDRIKAFIDDHEISQTFKYLRKEYYDAKKKIDDDCSFSIAKLEAVIHYLKSMYPNGATLAENDMAHIKSMQE